MAISFLKVTDEIGSDDQLKQRVMAEWTDATKNQAWDKMSEKQKEILLQSIAEIVAIETTKRYYGDKQLMRYSVPEVKLEELRPGLYGQKLLGENTILINSLNLDKPNKILSTLIHESTHHAQEIIKQNWLPLPGKNYPELMLIYSGTSRVYNDHNLFGINCFTRHYIHPPTESIISKMDRDIRRAFYQLQFIERQATNQAITATTAIGLNANYLINGQDDAIVDLSGRYNAFHLSDDKILKAIDDAQLSISNGEIPKDPRLASIAYDLMVLMYEQTPCEIEERIDRRIEIEHMIKNKDEVLSQHGIYNAQTIPFTEIGQYQLEQIQQLSQATRDQNPHIMCAAICQYGQEAAKLINIETFDQWYFSSENRFSDDILEKVAETLGHQYALVDRDIQDGDFLYTVDELGIDLVNGELPCVKEEKEIDLDAIFGSASSPEKALLEKIFGTESLSLDMGEDQSLDREK